MELVQRGSADTFDREAPLGDLLPTPDEAAELLEAVADESERPSFRSDVSRQATIDRLWPKALAVAEMILDDPEKWNPSAVTAAMKMVWEQKLGKAGTSAPDSAQPAKIVYEASPYNAMAAGGKG